jgi:ribonuclease HI
MIKAYVDGACSNQGGRRMPGGWAVILELVDRDTTFEIVSVVGGGDQSTNHRMALEAVINGILVVIEAKATLGCPNEEITVVTESTYVYNTFGPPRWVDKWEHHGWRAHRSPVENLDLVMVAHYLIHKYKVQLELVERNKHPVMLKASELSKGKMRELAGGGLKEPDQLQGSRGSVAKFKRKEGVVKNATKGLRSRMKTLERISR